MPTVTLLHRAKLGPFRVGACFPSWPPRISQRVGYRANNGVCARKDVYLVEKENTKFGRDIAGDPEMTECFSVIDLDRKPIGESYKGGISSAYPSLSDKGRAKLLTGEPGPKKALTKCGRIPHSLGTTINADFSSSCHRRLTLTRLPRETLLVIAKAA